MDIHQVCPGRAELLHIAQGPVDHQMDINKHIRRLAQGFEHRNPNGDIGDKLPVHNVKMDVIRSGFFDFSHFIAKAGKIRRED